MTQMRTQHRLMAASLGFGSLGLLWLHYDRRQRRKLPPSGQQQQQPRRTMSFTSVAMAMGAFPPETNFPDPVINVVLYFEQCPTTEELVEHVVKSLLQFDRLSQVPEPAQRTLRPLAVQLDPRRLIRRLRISSESEMIPTIQNHLMDCLSDPVARGADLPWWEVLVIENEGSGRSACVWRVHHALGDGLSLAAVVQRVLRHTDGSPITSAVTGKMMQRKARSFQVNSPTWYQKAARIWYGVVDLVYMSAGPVDDPTIFSRQYHPNMVHTQNREAVLFPTLDLNFVKGLKNAAPYPMTTVNDVLFTCLSHAIHNYLREHNCPILEQRGSDLLCRALIATAVPRSDLDTAGPDTLIRNMWSLVSCDMVVGCSDLLQRLQLVHTECSKLKQSPLALIVLFVQNGILKYAPIAFSRDACQGTMTRHSATYTNVPGPAKTCLFANHDVMGVHLLFGGLIPFVSFLSYRGKIFGTMTVDPEAVPDCQSLARLFGQSVVALADRLNVPVTGEQRTELVHQ